MFCPNCGSSVDENAEICLHCGVNVLKFNNQVNVAKMITQIFGLMSSAYAASLYLALSSILYGKTHNQKQQSLL